MIIERFEVKNFRSIRDVSLDCRNLTAMLGRNGAGKSCFLHALSVFYDLSYNISPEDFFDRDLESNIEIKVTYGRLRQDEKDEFSPYVVDDKLIVMKRISFQEGRPVQRYYASTLQIPVFAQIRSIPEKRNRIAAWKEFTKRSDIKGLETSFRSADQLEDFMKTYESEHPDLLEPLEKEEQFFGSRNIGGGKLDKYTKFVLVPAVCEATEEAFGKKGAINQLLDMVVFRKIESRKDVQEFRDKFEKEIKKLFNEDNFPELSELATSISEMLGQYSPGSKLNLSLNEIPDIRPPTPDIMATLIEDGFEGNINYKGHGLQRAFILTLLQQLAITTHITELQEGEEPENPEENIQLKPELIIAIEEPELYLHPSRSRYLSELFNKLTKSEADERVQILYTTHSPYFVDLDRFDNVRIVRKTQSPDSETLQSTVTQYSLTEAYEEIARICNIDSKEFTREGFKARATPIMDVIVNEGFFADSVLVVEGLSDTGIFWKLQEILKKNWAQKGIVICPAGGKTKMDRAIVIFRGLSIPTYFLFDGDNNKIGKSDEQKTKEINHRFLRLAGVEVEDFPDTQIHETWAIFEDKLEKTIKEELGETNYNGILTIIKEKLGYDDPKDVLKNIEGSSMFIELLYEKGYNLSTLEQIVEKVTELAST